jgi:parallel beta-helix repeat protein
MKTHYITLSKEEQKMKKVVKSAFALLMVFYVLSTVNPVSASAALTADRSISGTICPGSTFTVTITLDVTGSPVKGLSITEDLSALPDGWTVAPNDGGIYNAGSKKLEYIWFDPSGSIGDETVTYDVTVSGDARVGASYDITGKTELTPPKTTVDIGTDTDTVTVIVCEDSLSVTVLYPNGGESIPIGTQVQVSAHATNDVKVTSVHFYYSSNGGSSWNPIGAGTIVSGTAKDGIWNRTWNTNGLSAGTNYVIKAVASDGTLTNEDQSDSTFSLTPSKLIRVPVDYPTIQAAIDAASSGSTIKVSSGKYFEHLVIDKPLKLIGEDKNTTIINGSGSGSCVHITADNVEISGLTIRNSFYGAYLESSNESILDKNIISDNEEGIYLINSNNNMITNNSLFNNVLSLSGIHLSSSNNNVIRDNDLVENDIGVSLRESNNNLIYHNNFIDNIIRQAFDDTGTNSWDKGPVEGGNYWSDHSCIGNPSDKSYSIYTDGVDHYPFQDQNGWLKGNQPPVTSGNAGAISVSSSPSGATILLEGFVGPSIKTPYTITNVPVGMSTITLSLDGYPDWSTSVYVMAGETSYVDAILTPIQTAGPISVASSINIPDFLRLIN